ncbi:MAG TPA: dTDP-4-dehydrorhamnose reductase [Thermoleophilaceae bacterium]|nr:dTDP-4-dehydrorhamnose reductase [Thermoleophilaceae bacterium]
MRLVIVGAGGMLGRAVTRAAGSGALALARSDLDVTDRAAVRAALAGAHTVINCAAWTDVDGAERHPDEAMRVNRDGARNVAEAAERVLYVSSDYVFDGRKGAPYLPGDEPNPLSAYGRSKLAGERATAEANHRHIVVRSSWLFGPGGRNFADTILRLATERDSIRVVDDQLGCPTYTRHLAHALLQIARSDAYGTHHSAAAGQCSWFRFASYLVERAGLDCIVEACTTEEFRRSAPRPRYSVLQSTGGEVEAAGAPTLPRWEQGADDYLAERRAA